MLLLDGIMLISLSQHRATMVLYEYAGESLCWPAYQVHMLICMQTDTGSKHGVEQLSQ